MFDYLYKFKDLEEGLRLAVSNPRSLSLIEELEARYHVNLAPIIMRVMTKDIKIESLALNLSSELNLNQNKAESLAEELKEKIFVDLSEYLGFVPKKDLSKKDLSNEVKVEKKLQDNIEKKGLFDENKIEERDALDQAKPFDRLAWIKELIVKLKISFKSEEDRGRFTSLMDKYIRGVKNKIDVREFLMRDLTQRGFSLSEKIVDDIFFILDQKKEEKLKELRKSVDLDKDVLQRIKKLSYGQIAALSSQETHLLDDPKVKNLKVAPDLEKLKEAKKTELIEAPDKINLIKASGQFREEGKLDSALTQASINSLVQVLSSKPQAQIEQEKREEEARVRAEKEAQEKLKEQERLAKLKEEAENKERELKEARQRAVEEELAKKEAEKKTPKPSWSRLPSGKIKMDEIKRIKPMGPVDELKYMNPLDFRRLDGNPEEAFAKISQKLIVLENIDYSKMIEGIKAWRQNPINKLYLNIFAQAGNEGKSVDQVIAERKAAGKDYLSKEEIAHLIQFNKKLSF